MIRLMIVDDNDEIRSYFRLILSREPDIEMVGDASTGREGVRLAQQLQPDVVLMDIQMETDTAGIDAAAQIHATLPHCKVIILTIHSDDEMLFRAYNAGAMDYIVKTDSITQIVSSIHSVYQNQLQLRSDVATKIVSAFTQLQKQHASLLYTINILTRLTNSEFEVLRCIYDGVSYKDIAKSRFVSQATIKSQVNSILKKFDMLRMKDVVSMLHEIEFEKICHSKE